ncbi:hypothetical protein KUCAC02_026604 [Chaenocephalus aceratus]|nr:hypothetical protein KUCAC02_026604 [Chaenocephalus aceratus]
MSSVEKTIRNQKSSKNKEKSMKTTTASISAPSMAKSEKAGDASKTSMEDILRSIEKSNQEVRGAIQLMREDVK